MVLLCAIVTSSFLFGDTPRPAKFDSGRAVVVHPPADSRAIISTEGTPSPELDDAPTEEHTVPALETATRQPNAEGALENDSAFKKSAARAWAATSYGKVAEERGFIVSNRSKIGHKTRAEISAATGGAMPIEIPSDAFASFHTHPDGHSLSPNLMPKPSPPDVAVAKENRLNLYVLSREGLYLVEPDGTLHKIYDTPADVADPKKKAVDRMVAIDAKDRVRQ